MSVYVGYEPASRCTTGPQPGAKALMAAFLGVYGTRGGTNLGIFNCRPVRGSTNTTSLHGEGRACDFGINPHGAAWGTTLADLLRLHSAELGVQCVIWSRRIWSGAKPHAGWRAYTGTNPHLDHIHLELSWKAASGLTADVAHQVLSGPAARPSPTSPGVLMALTDLEQAELLRGVRELQKLKPGLVLLARSPHAAPKQDDMFGASLNAWAEAANARVAVEQLAARLAGGASTAPGALSDADLDRIAVRVVDLLSRRTAS